MKLLTETADINELNRIRILFESNGIPIHIVNEDSGRNFGLIMPARKYAILVVHEEQFSDAALLLEDDSHVVKNQIDMDAYRNNIEQLKPKAGKQMFKVIMLTGVTLLMILIGLAWFMEAINA